MMRRLSYANVMSSVAVFLALGGISWAAVKLPNGSVGTAQLKTGAVTGAKVKNGSLTAADLRGGLPVGERGAAGPQGPAGAQGPAGVAGPKGETGLPGTRGGPGAKGDAGAAGTAGAPGAKGATGSTGPAGADFAFTRTIVIRATGDQAADGQAVIDAVNGATDANSAKPMLLKLEPGSYVLPSTLVMKSGLDVEGSGPRTTLQGPVGGTIVRGASATLSNLTLLSPSFGGATIAYDVLSGFPIVRDVQITMNNAGTTTAVRANSNLLLRDVDIDMSNSGTGGAARGVDVIGNIGLTTIDGGSIVTSQSTTSEAVRTNLGRVIVSNAVLRSTGPNSSPGLGTVNAVNASVRIDASDLSADDGTGGLVVRASNTADVRIGASRVVGSVIEPVGTSVVCASSYDEDYAPFTC